jgi:hypothetical protein
MAILKTDESFWDFRRWPLMRYVSEEQRYDSQTERNFWGIIISAFISFAFSLPASIISWNIFGSVGLNALIFCVFGPLLALLFVYSGYTHPLHGLSRQRLTGWADDNYVSTTPDLFLARRYLALPKHQKAMFPQDLLSIWKDPYLTNNDHLLLNQACEELFSQIDAQQRLKEQMIQREQQG